MSLRFNELRDDSPPIERHVYKSEMGRLQEHVRLLSHRAADARRSILVVMEGWDAAGKGGAIRRLTATLDPRLFSVNSIAAPNDLEKKHHYLWRFWTRLPQRGLLGIFDRSWYGRVLVERVENLIGQAEWSRAYQEINDFERDLVLSGAIILKYWLHISKEEQHNRFMARQNDPLKRWKLTDEDWRNREKWNLYEQAAEEMFLKTGTAACPWVLVPGNDKYRARVFLLSAFCDRVSRELGDD
jgi:polyphosphate kinase 2 (PPK2 family)